MSCPHLKPFPPGPARSPLLILLLLAVLALLAALLLLLLGPGDTCFLLPSFTGLLLLPPLPLLLLLLLLAPDAADISCWALLAH